jgi:hypothetical protein
MFRLFDLVTLWLDNISLGKESVLKPRDIAWFCKIPTGFASVQSYENEQAWVICAGVHERKNRRGIASKTMDCVAANQTQCTGRLRTL